jgi:hypothetical protein
VGEEFFVIKMGEYIEYQYDYYARNTIPTAKTGNSTKVLFKRTLSPSSFHFFIALKL